MEVKENEIVEELDKTNEENTVEKTEVDKYIEEIANLKEQLKEEENKYMRLSADFQNFSKRKQKELEESVLYSSKEIIKKILPTFENLERAIVAYKNSNLDENDNLFIGVNMTYNNFKTVLENEGLEIINPIGEKYDPNFHEAVMVVNDENKENEEIVSVFSNGYKLKGKLVQTAKVQINKK